MKTWPIIRHLRYFYWARRLAQWFALWQQVGALHVQESDLQYLDDIWHGRA
jgi:hypothetical protein